MIHVRPALPEDASRMVEVMERAFEPTFGEAWNAAQLVSALSQPESFGELAIAKSSAVAFTLARLISTEAEAGAAAAPGATIAGAPTVARSASRGGSSTTMLAKAGASSASAGTTSSPRFAR